MTAHSLNELVLRAQSDPKLFEALSVRPETVIPGFDAADSVVRGALDGVVAGQASAEHGAYSGCNSTSCGCGGSI